MKKRQKTIPRNGTEYRNQKLDEEKYAEIKKNRHYGKASMLKRISQLIEQKMSSSRGWMKSKEGTLNRKGRSS